MKKAIILVEVTVTLDFQNGRVPILDSYSGKSTPGGRDVVLSTGAIDLTKVSKDADDSTITVISFVLEYKNNPGLRTAWFEHIELTDNLKAPYNGPELKGAVTSNQVVILDLDLDGQTYNYCLTVNYGIAPSFGTLRLDPPIVNRGRTD